MLDRTQITEDKVDEVTLSNLSSIDGKTYTVTMLHNCDNMLADISMPIDVMFADYVYENSDFDWVDKFWEMLKPNGIFIAMADYHSDYLFRYYMEQVIGATFVNDAKWLNEWGNHPKNRMHQCYDSIMVYAKGKSWHFNSDVIQVPKKTLTKGLNPSGRTTKTATAWIDDITLTTTAKERVRTKDGKLIRWQKPIRLYDRIIAPFCSEKSLIVDLFMGSGSLGKWCRLNKRHYIGYENDRDIFDVAKENIFTP